MEAILRQAVFSHLAGHEDAEDAESLRVGPARRRPGWILVETR